MNRIFICLNFRYFKKIELFKKVINVFLCVFHLILKKVILLKVYKSLL